MYGALQQHLRKELDGIREAGLYKRERIITSEQGAEITVNGKQVLNQVGARRDRFVPWHLAQHRAVDA